MKTKMLAILTAAIILICPISGCRDNDGSATQSKGSSESVHSFSENEASNSAVLTDESEELSSESESENTLSKAVSSNKASSAPTGCQHNYQRAVVAPTCTTGGYTTFTCTKCGNSYRGEETAPQHDYNKYFCKLCGKIDPDQSEYMTALKQWVLEYGALTGNEDFRCYPYVDAPIEITVGVYYDNILSFDGYDTASGITFRLVPDDQHDCTMIFRDNQTYAFGSQDIKNSGVSSSVPLRFIEFGCGMNPEETTETFAARCQPLIDGYMRRIENEILYPKTGLHLRDLGFTAY